MKLIDVTGKTGKYKVNPDNIETIAWLTVSNETVLTMVSQKEFFCLETPIEVESLIQKADRLG